MRSCIHGQLQKVNETDTIIKELFPVLCCEAAMLDKEVYSYAVTRKYSIDRLSCSGCVLRYDGKYRIRKVTSPSGFSWKLTRNTRSTNKFLVQVGAKRKLFFQEWKRYKRKRRSSCVPSRKETLKNSGRNVFRSVLSR